MSLFFIPTLEINLIGCEPWGFIGFGPGLCQKSGALGFGALGCKSIKEII